MYERLKKLFETKLFQYYKCFLNEIQKTFQTDFDFEDLDKILLELAKVYHESVKEKVYYIGISPEEAKEEEFGEEE